jgi:hypothetical protein
VTSSTTMPFPQFKPSHQGFENRAQVKVECPSW